MGPDCRKIALFTSRFTPVAEYLTAMGTLACVVDFSTDNDRSLESFCDKNGIPHIAFNNWEQVTAFISGQRPQLLVSHKIPRIIPSQIISLFPLGGINIHPSLLPRYAGADPWFAVYYNMERQSGVTIHRLTHVPDGGDILLQESFPIDMGDPLPVVINRADTLAAKQLAECLNDGLLSAAGTPQTPEKAPSVTIGKNLFNMEVERVWHLLRGFPSLLGQLGARLNHKQWAIGAYERCDNHISTSGTISFHDDIARLHCPGGDIIIHNFGMLPQASDYIDSVNSSPVTPLPPPWDNGLIERDMCGRPVVKQGMWNIVMPLTLNGRRWAVRFTKGLTRPQLIHNAEKGKMVMDYLTSTQLPYFLETHYITEAITTPKGVFPATITEWVDSPTLESILTTRNADTELLKNLAKQFDLMVNDLRRFKIAHGDLHPGNIIVTTDGSLKLIDYDTMYVPGLETEPDTYGARCEFQHPARRENRYLNSGLDNYSAQKISQMLNSAITTALSFNV